MSDVAFKPGDRVHFTGSLEDPDDCVDGTVVDPRDIGMEKKISGWDLMVPLVEAAAKATGDLENLFWVLPDEGSDPEYDAHLAETGEPNIPFYAFREELTLLEV